MSNNSKYVRRTYRCELLTPMIMSGADQSVAELRAPSFKGALRWWWRALNPTLPGPDGRYTVLRKKEDQLFGGVHGESALKSKVSLSVKWEAPESLTASDGNSESKWVNPGKHNERPDAKDPITYLLFGAYRMGDNQVRTMILPDGGKAAFLLSIRCERTVWPSVEPAVQAALTFGGFGLKHRNGFGQVSYRIADEEGNFTDEAIDVATFARRNPNTGQVGYAAFTKHSKLSKLYPSRGAGWRRIIEDAGRMYMNAKSAIDELTGEGRNHEIGFQTGEKNSFAAFKPGMWSYGVPDPSGDLGRLDKSIQIFAVRSSGATKYGFLTLPYEVSINGSGLSSTTIRNLGGWKPSNGKYAFDLRPPQRTRIETIDTFFANLRNPTA